MSLVNTINISFRQKRRSDIFEVLTRAAKKTTLKERSYDNALKSFVGNLQRAGVRIRQNVPGDGNCLFHAVCDQLRRLKIARMRHIELRKRAIEYLRNNPTVVNYNNYYLMYATI